MPARTKKRAKKKRRVASARTVADKAGSGFERTTLNIPDGMSMFAPKEGVYKIDIIGFEANESNPNVDEGDFTFERTFWVYRDIGPDQNAYCSGKTFGKRDYIQKHLAEMKREPNYDEDLAKALQPKPRQLFYVFDHGEPDKGVQLWDVSFHLFGKRLNKQIQLSDPDQGYDTFHDPDEGMTLRITCEEVSRGGFTFIEVIAIDFLRRRKPLDPALLDVPCLDEVPKETPYDELKKIFLMTDDEDEDENEEPTPKKRGKTKAASASTAKSGTKGGKTAKKSRSKPEPEPDEEEWDEDEEWDEEEAEAEEAEAEYDEDEEWDEEEDEYEEEDEEVEDEEEWDEDEYEEEEAEEEWDEEDEEEWDEEE